jgi:type VI secretion system protein ImpF
MAFKGFEPSLYDKIFPRQAGPDYIVRRLSLEELKETIARDIESLLNTRMMYKEEELESFPQCQKSILTFGINDFSGMSLASYYDRTTICASIERAISRHEPRLKAPRVKLLIDPHSTQTLSFAITAILSVGEAHEPVAFDAKLKPTTLQYTVSKTQIGRQTNY